MPGKSYIKVTSILLILSAVVAVIVYPIAGLLLGYATIDTGEELGWLFVVISLLYTIAAILQLTAGVKGVRGCDDRSAAEDLKKWGKIVLAVSVISGIVNFIALVMHDGALLTGIISILFSFAFPALYIYGADLNEKSCRP